MKIDLRANPLDPRGQRYAAYLDGILLSYCLMADEEAGVAITWDFEQKVDVEHHGRVELRPVEQP
jgi:hypothetical protein